MAGISANAALARLAVAPDFEYGKPRPDTEILFLHRHLPDAELYFLSNRKPRVEQIEASFRAAGREPEIWRAETGQAAPVSFRIQNQRTLIPLRLNPYESFFVVFRGPTTAASRTVPEPAFAPLATLDTGWTVSFQPGRGAPTVPQATSLGPWTGDSNAGIRYFSGTARYTKTLSVPTGWVSGKPRLVLDLGDVRELAEVFVNDRPLGVLWRPPYRVDVGDALHAGDNHLEIRVTNLWVNRLIGDAQPGAERVTFTIGLPYRADGPLRESGLLGPVRLERAPRQP